MNQHLNDTKKYNKQEILTKLNIENQKKMFKSVNIYQDVILKT